MNELEQRIVDAVRRRLGDARFQNTILYLDSTSRQFGERITVGDAVIEMPWDGYVAFADFEPRANWGHACSYYAVDRTGDEIIEFRAHMPPFLKADGPPFHLLWRGALAPEWAVHGRAES